MIEQKEFVREGHSTFLRSPLKEELDNRHEYEMCKHNKIDGVIPFHICSQNGECYMQYNVSSLQSIDVFYRKKKLDIEQITCFLENIMDTYKNCKTYLLNINKIVYTPKFIMYDLYQKKYQFFYDFEDEEENQLEELVVFLIENMDYSNITLVKVMHEFYENIVDSEDYVEKDKLVKNILSKIYTIKEVSKELENPMVQVFENKGEGEIDPIKIYTESCNKESVVMLKYKRQIKIGIIGGALINCLIFGVWKPYTLMKIFAFIVFSVMFALLFWQQKVSANRRKEVEREETTLHDFKQYISYEEENQYETRLIKVKQMEGILRKKSKEIVEDILFLEGEHIIGSNREQAHVVIPLEGISRIHAAISFFEDKYYLEDLNSTNGTWINDMQLQPRKKVELHVGDQVVFAKYEYEFQ